MVNYQKMTKSSVSHLLKLIDTCVTGIEVRRRKGEKNIKILYNLLMRWDFLMGKIHRVWRRESKLPFHIIHLFTTLNCLGEIAVGDSTDPFLFSPSPCLPLPCHTQNTRRGFPDRREKRIPCCARICAQEWPCPADMCLCRHNSFRNTVLNRDL